MSMRLQLLPAGFRRTLLLPATVLSFICGSLILLASPVQAVAVHYCDELPKSIRAWYAEHAQSIFPDNDYAPNLIMICLSDPNSLQIALRYEVRDAPIRKSERQWESDFFVYYPMNGNLLLYSAKPMNYITSFLGTYWNLAARTGRQQYAEQTGFMVVLQKGSEMFATGYQGSQIMSTGYIFIVVESYDPQEFMSFTTSRAITLTTPRTLSGDLSQQGLVYKFFGVLDADPKSTR